MPDQDLSGQFNTPIPPELMPDYLRWVQQESQKRGKDIRRDMYDYDVQGLFMALRSGKKGLQDEKTGHSTDMFKKPNHPTFSSESIYSGKNGFEGGKWGKTAEGQAEYTPSKTNLQYRDPNDLFMYFRQVEPNIRLNLPEGGKGYVSDIIKTPDTKGVK
jgi:hypothetical protein